MAKGKTDAQASRIAMSRSGLSEAKFTQANNLFEEKFGLAERTAATNADMTADQWERTKAAQKSMDDRESEYWQGIMGGRGTEVTMSSLSSLFAPRIEDRPEAFGPMQDAVSAVVDDRFSTNAEDGKALARGFMNDISGNPTQALAWIDEVFQYVGREGTHPSIRDVSKKSLRKKGVSEGFIELFLGGGNKTAANLENIRNSIMEFNASDEGLNYETQDFSQMPSEEIVQRLNDRYGASEVTLDQVERMKNNGEAITVVPDNWIESFDPIDRAELLSLIHGGTSFEIAQKSPGLLETIGMFAGQAGIAAAGNIGR